ncbi:MAG: TIGR04255 family protein [Treponema sp.]|jgi:uncharacterized protein (TIGR04255 family)|nr:TIGR04255 family protein [Treponema sp.]
MNVKRNCPYKPLSRQPLVLVLAQARFSPVPKIEEFLPEVQDFLRKNGYPMNPGQKNVLFEVGPNGIRQTEVRQWQFENPDRTASILLDHEQILLQTTTYDRFENFVREFLKILSFILEITESDKFGVIGRLGLRYVDLIRKQTRDDSIDSYLRPELRGILCSEYIDKRKQYTLSTTGKTSLNDNRAGTLTIRIMRGEKGLDLPPDLLGAAPSNRRPVSADEDLAIVDMDHYWNGSIGPNIEIPVIGEILFSLHDSIINGFHKSVITEGGIKKWK